MEMGMCQRETIPTIEQTIAEIIHYITKCTFMENIKGTILMVEDNP